MKKTKINLDSIVEKEIREAIAQVNALPEIKKVGKIRVRKEATKMALAKALTEKVGDLSDAKIEMPEEVDVLAGKIDALLKDEPPVAPPIEPPATKGPTSGKKPAKTDVKPDVKAKKNPFNRDPNVPTKKSICISMISRKGGATIDEMAQECVRAKLGDLDLCKKVCKLWMPKLGIKVRKSEDGKFTRA